MAENRLDTGLQEKRVTFLTITSGPKGTAVYFDGSLKKKYPHFQIAYEDLSGQIVLSSSTVRPYAWPGDVHGLALYSLIAFSSVFEEHRQGESLQARKNPTGDACASHERKSRRFDPTDTVAILETRIARFFRYSEADA